MLLDWYNLRLDDHSWRQGMALNSTMMIKLVTTNALGVLQLPWSSPSCKFLPAGAQEKWVAPKTHTNSLFHLPRWLASTLTIRQKAISFRKRWLGSHPR